MIVISSVESDILMWHLLLCAFFQGREWFWTLKGVYFLSSSVFLRYQSSNFLSPSTLAMRNFYFTSLISKKTCICGEKIKYITIKTVLAWILKGGKYLHLNLQLLSGYIFYGFFHAVSYTLSLVNNSIFLNY